MACGRYEVYAAVNPGVWDPLLPVDVDFLLQVGFILVVDELHNGLPADKGNRNQHTVKNFCLHDFRLQQELIIVMCGFMQWWNVSKYIYFSI